MASPEPWACSKFPVSWWEVQGQVYCGNSELGIWNVSPAHQLGHTAVSRLVIRGLSPAPSSTTTTISAPGLLVSSKVLYLLSNPKFAFFFWRSILNISTLNSYSGSLKELKTPSCLPPSQISPCFWAERDLIWMPSLWRCSKAILDVALGSLWAGASFSEWQPCQWRGCSNKMIFEVPSNQHHSMILWFILLLILAPKYSMAIFYPS